ncbi:hypothetical protein BT93_L5336 [Corymbia citriodora subsp. variegata]|uniref:Uncharacterized protein n=1 Tax=Corymbia citriodora subsp. variegata TaxID=360336 RepID=A0A8T0D164_CORYI|nr:hypothetical protein BT93_L5336 [Corymbia citriodora subsp. variegata]
MRAACEASLRWLKVDCTDLYYQCRIGVTQVRGGEHRVPDLPWCVATSRVTSEPSSSASDELQLQRDRQSSQKSDSNPI